LNFCDINLVVCSSNDFAQNDIRSRPQIVERVVTCRELRKCVGRDRMMKFWWLWAPLKSSGFQKQKAVLVSLCVLTAVVIVIIWKSNPSRTKNA